MDALRKPWLWVCLLVALLVRVPAITSLPIDWDEPIYMEAAQAFAAAMNAADWSSIFNPNVNPEHPSLVKMLYAFGFMAFGGEPDLVERLMVVRGLSLMAGLALVVVAARVNPVAGLALGVHTVHAKYSCQGYLESLPALWMALAMLLAWSRREDLNVRTIVCCGVLWGAAIAGKWIHGVPGILLFLVWRDARSKCMLLAVSIFSIWVLDPTMWLHPLERVGAMMAHHRAYAESVPDSSMWTPWLTLAGGGPSVWHPDIFPWSVDGVLLAFGLLGMGLRLRTPWGRFVTGWFLLPLLVLMTWETRWPQHLMVVLMPLSLGVMMALEPILSRANRHSGPSDSHPPASA